MTQGLIADGRRRPWGFVLEAIEGWFHPADWYAFDGLLAGQEARQMTGDLLSFHEKLPVIVQGASSIIAAHVKPGTCRFVHVDASHLYHHVKADIETARDLLLPDGIIALDDYRGAHTPGVAAATWEAVLNGGLKPVLLTEFKLYGTWGDAAAFREPLLRWLASHRDIWGMAEDVAGNSLVRMHYR